MRWPTESWQEMQSMRSSAAPPCGSIAETMSAWQRRHWSWVTSRLRGVIWIGSWKSPFVKATEWW